MSDRISEIIKENDEYWNLYTFKNYDYLNQEYGSVNKIISDKFFTDPYISNYLFEREYRINYPENRSFAVCLTHDVDEIYPPLRYTLLSSLYNLKKMNPRGVVSQFSWKLKGKQYSPYINFKEIMNIEARFDANSSFYFLSTDKDIIRFRYEIEDLENKIGVIIDNGSEVGLHGGNFAYDDPDQISIEKRRLEKVLNRQIIGNRFHYLSFKIPETWEHLSRAGFKYDTTIGNNRIVGFKNGLCHPYRPFSADKNVEMDILEIPLSLSDFTLMNAKIPFSQKWDIAKTIIDNTEKCGGILTVLWHSDAFNNSYLSDWTRFYVKILDYCHKKKAWITSGENVYRWAYKSL